MGLQRCARTRAHRGRFARGQPAAWLSLEAGRNADAVETLGPSASAATSSSQVRPRPDSLRAAPWRDMARPTLDEMY
jgi:hypothetical protein